MIILFLAQVSYSKIHAQVGNSKILAKASDSKILAQEERTQTKK